MANENLSRSNYLKIMYGDSNSNVVLQNQINNVNDTSYTSAALKQDLTNTQALAKSTINNADKYLEGVKGQSEKKVERNFWQQFLDTIDTITNDLYEGLFNFADDIGDLGIDIADAIMGGNNQWAKDARDYDWQAQALKGVAAVNTTTYLKGDGFSSEFWSNWDAKSARDYINIVNDGSLGNYLGEDIYNFSKGVFQNIGYMLPSISFRRIYFK